MGLSDAAKLEVVEIVRRELERLLPLRNVATKEDIKILVELFPEVPLEKIVKRLNGKFNILKVEKGCFVGSD